MAERIVNGNVPYILPISYIDDYQRLLERLAENYSGNAAQAIRHWNGGLS